VVVTVGFPDGLAVCVPAKMAVVSGAEIRQKRQNVRCLRVLPIFTNEVARDATAVVAVVLAVWHTSSVAAGVSELATAPRTVESVNKVITAALTGIYVPPEELPIRGSVVYRLREWCHVRLIFRDAQAKLHEMKERFVEEKVREKKDVQNTYIVALDPRIASTYHTPWLRELREWKGFAAIVEWIHSQVELITPGPS
jgi:hypothetical protein